MLRLAGGIVKYIFLLPICLTKPEMHFKAPATLYFFAHAATVGKGERGGRKSIHSSFTLSRGKQAFASDSGELRVLKSRAITMIQMI